MRTPFRPDVATSRIDQVDLVDVEEAILDARIPVIRDRSTNTRNRLICETGVRIVDEARAIRPDREVVLDPRNADTASNKALKAVVIAEIQHAIDHERERRGITTDIVVSSNNCRTRARQSRTRGSNRSLVNDEYVGIRAAIACFGFEAEAAEVVADDTAEVVTRVVIYGNGLLVCTDAEVRIFEDHNTPVELYIPRVIACQRGRSQRSRRHGQAYDQFPHYRFPFYNRNAKFPAKVPGSGNLFIGEATAVQAGKIRNLLQ